VKNRSTDGQLPELSLIIPAYNEEAAIGDIVRRAIEVLPRCAAQWEVIVVSDCSTDGTAEIAAAAGARVIEHPLNKGYGNSLKTGITSAAYHTIAIIDADGSYPPEELLRLIPFAGTFDMVVGQRVGSNFRGGPFKRAGRRLQLFLVEFTTGTKVPDVNSGLRLFPRDAALNYFDTLCGGFSFTTSITLTMLARDYTVKFVPISYEPRIGKSHVSYFRDTLRSLQIITHAILKYNPIKAFLPLCFVALAGAVLTGGPAVAALLLGAPLPAAWLGLSAVLCLLTALVIFALGLVATTISVARPATPPPDRRTS
jgi:glycosyltransferase involved in cell wall biosynthesis